MRMLGFRPSTSPPLPEETREISPISITIIPDVVEWWTKAGRQHTPEMSDIFAEQGLFQPRLCPQPVCEPSVVDLEAVVDPHGLAALGPARGGDEGQLAEEGDVVPAQRAGEEGPQDDHLVRDEGLEREVDDGQGGLEWRPGGCGRLRWRSC
jgi:hypothetical protein